MERYRILSVRCWWNSRKIIREIINPRAQAVDNTIDRNDSRSKYRGSHVWMALQPLLIEKLLNRSDQQASTVLIVTKEDQA
jgi:hypothetical protein